MERVNDKKREVRKDVKIRPAECKAFSTGFILLPVNEEELTH